MQAVQLTPDMYQPEAPGKHDYRIGILGCGGIVRGAHLPAYGSFGYHVVAACDLIADNVKDAQDRFGIPKITTQVDELLANEEVQILDLAVHANQRLPLVERICELRPGNLLGILSQKPFAMQWEDATRMVELCAQTGIVLMVNQQARWAPAHRALKVLIEQGILGHVYCVTHFHRSFQDVPGSWYAALENFNIVDHGIHYIDLLRNFTGLNPIRVKAAATMVPGQAAVSPMCHTILCEFAPANQVMGMSHFNNIVQTSALHEYGWYVDGTEGSACASRNEVVVSLRAYPQHKQVFQIQGSWFPDAFGGSMGELMQSLNENREPMTSGRDNLNSIRIAYAAVESAATGRSVDLAS